MTTPTQVGAPIYVFFAAGGNVRLFTQNKKHADEFAFDNDQQPVIYTAEGAQPVALSTLTDEQIDEAAHELQRVIAFCGGEPSEFPYDYLRGILEKLPAASAQPAGQTEPIGWLKPNESYAPSAFRRERTNEHAKPLIAASAVHEPAKAAPVPEQNYAECWVCGRPMDGKSEDDCHCFHRKELSPLPPAALAAARAFGAGLDADSLEQPSEVV